MKHDDLQYEFTIKELTYYLFKKKICPQCSGKMIKGKYYETVDGHALNNAHEAFFAANARVKRYHHIFTCPNCKAVYPISELAK